MEKLNEIIFYNIDKAIRTYRVFAQKQLKLKGYKITIDQWLIIRSILENPDISQQEIGEIVFKDNASVTRIIELLVKAKYIVRKPYANDRRRVKLIVTPECRKIIDDMHQVVIRNRKTALANIDPKNIQLVNRVLNEIIDNCKGK
jgi:MarR family transcriptional regulator for hemolysin